MVDSLLCCVSIILEAATVAQEAYDTIVLLFIAAAMVASFTGTILSLGCDWLCNKMKIGSTHILKWAI